MPWFRDISHVINDSVDACFCFLVMPMRSVLSRLDPTPIQAIGTVTWPDNTVHSSAAHSNQCPELLKGHRMPCMDVVMPWYRGCQE